jgi:murein L,D-transpeptidase YcbB/YkuD
LRRRNIGQPSTQERLEGRGGDGFAGQLYRLGYDPGAQDGVFGRRTESAVKQFQGDKGLAADGIVGPQTWAALEAAIAEYVE